MRKGLALLLAAALCFSLGACSGGTQTNGTGAPQGTENAANRQAAAMVVHLVINPELKIYMDNDGNVFDVECLNDDANAVNKKVSVIGKTCKDAIALLLNEMLAQGFLKNNANIEVTIFLTEELAGQAPVWMDTIENSVTEVFAENSLSANFIIDNKIMRSKAPESSGTDEQISSVNTENHDSEILSVETDANGNTVCREKSGTIAVLDKDGKVLQVADPGGVIRNFNYDGVGNLLSEECVQPNGPITVTIYDSNGKITAKEITSQDGNVATYQYDDAGKTVSENQMGTTMSYTYYSDGSIKSEIEQQSTGYSCERSYYKNGSLSREYQHFPDSTFSETSYDESGNRTKFKWNFGDGTEDRTYNSDGTCYAYFYCPNGDVFYYEFDANGRQLLETHRQIK